MKEIKYRYEERVIKLFYYFGINKPFDKECAYKYLSQLNSNITINSVRDTLERVIWANKYLEEDTYNQWYWHQQGIHDISKRNNWMMSIFMDRNKLNGVDKRKNYYRFSAKTAYNLINDYELDLNEDLKKQITKGILLNK